MGPGEVFGDIAFLDATDIVRCWGTNNCCCRRDKRGLIVSRETVEMLAFLHVEAASQFWQSLAVSAAMQLCGRYVALLPLHAARNILKL
jgi:hypothetical protein